MFRTKSARRLSSSSPRLLRRFWRQPWRGRVEVVPAQAARPRKLSRRSGRPYGKPALVPRVLLAEDDAQMSRLLSRLLELEGFETLALSPVDDVPARARDE